jgi:hypothetical protein
MALRVMLMQARRLQFVIEGRRRCFSSGQAMPDGYWIWVSQISGRICGRLMSILSRATLRSEPD